MFGQQEELLLFPSYAAQTSRRRHAAEKVQKGGFTYGDVWPPLAGPGSAGELIETSG